MTEETELKVIIIPGNGCYPILDCNWYQWLQESLLENGIRAIARNMPDPNDAKESIWIPFIIETLNCDASTIIVGHSSGAEAAMRLLENHKVKGCILVSACHTDLGIRSNLNRPWEWDKIKSNTDFLIQFGSRDDHLVPFSEQEYVATHLNSEFIIHSNSGHFLSYSFPDLLNVIIQKFIGFRLSKEVTDPGDISNTYIVRINHW